MTFPKVHMVGPRTKSFWRAQLPHWEIDGGSYFVTIRCAGSLPKNIAERAKTILRDLQEFEPDSEGFLKVQRRYFQTTEKYLDKGQGFCPFRDSRCCEVILEKLEALEGKGWNLRHFAILPNHLHVLMSTTISADPMKSVWPRWKGITARECNRILGRSGPFWQREWFDRWMRDEMNTQKTIKYIRQNPVKAGLVKNWEDYPWVK
ncbi:MAG: transposase [Opitutales bacterium]|nr:transposase [Opitutales bacterium]MCH8541181.1 transposase [Opitutales bacterium]